MKKKFLPTFLILNFSFLISIHAQFLQGIGFTLGGTAANQKWKISPPDPDPNGFGNTTERKKFVFGFNGAVFAEFIDDENFHWQSEIQFNQKGAKNKVNDSTKYTSRLNYISWNNYLKYKWELVSIAPYFFAGPQLEYLLSQRDPNPFVTDRYKKLHVSIGVGAGIELLTLGRFKPFVEAIYNPDLISKAYTTTPLKIKNRAYEIRIGFKISLKKGKKDMDCNAPTYIPDF